MLIESGHLKNELNMISNFSVNCKIFINNHFKITSQKVHLDKHVL